METVDIKRHASWGIPTIIASLLAVFQLYSMIAGSIKTHLQEKQELEARILRLEIDLCGMREGYVWDMYVMRCEKE